MAILQCYRHLFYPSSSRMTGAQLDLGHTIIELSGAGDSPGNGQHQVERVLHEQKKLLEARDTPDSPPFVRDQSGLRVKGEMTTAQIRTEYRRAPKLSILLHDTPLFECIRNGIDQGVFIYREGSQVWGPGDPRPVIHISDNHFLHTIDDAKAKKLWPRAEPLEVRFQANPTTIERGGSSELVVSVKGGVPPYTYTSNEPQLAATASDQATQQLRVRPEQSMTYTVEVTDSRGQRQQAHGGGDHPGEIGRDSAAGIAGIQARRATAAGTLRAGAARPGAGRSVGQGAQGQGGQHRESHGAPVRSRRHVEGASGHGNAPGGGCHVPLRGGHRSRRNRAVRSELHRTGGQGERREIVPRSADPGSQSIRSSRPATAWLSSSRYR